MTKILIILFILILPMAFAQETFEDFDNQDPTLDALYIRGEYLVYDCASRHWVCTGKLEFDRCKEQRTQALLDFKEQLPCGYFYEFKNRALCEKSQQKYTNNARFEEYCYHPEVRTMKN